MNITGITEIAGRTFHRGLLLTKKHSPTILTTVGIVGSLTSTVLASRATLKLEPILDELETGRAAVADNYNLGALPHTSDYTDRHRAKDTLYVYGRAGLKLTKLYALPLTVQAVSIGCLIGSHNIQQTRNTALVAAYATIEKSFSAYRKRVEEAVGTDKERELLYGGTADIISDTEKGTAQEVIRVDGAIRMSPYAAWFDDTNKNWVQEATYNLSFLEGQQNWFNHVLRSKGHVFLNEVYDALGLPRTREGAIVGWLYNGTGDRYIDFHIYDSAKPEKIREVVNGFEGAILLDFNVDGTIFDKI